MASSDDESYKESDVSKSAGVLHYMSQFADLCETYFENHKHSDVTLVIAGKHKIPAHRFILAAESEFFDVLLYGENFNEAGKREIPIEDVGFQEFMALLRFLYCIEVDLSNKSLYFTLKLLELARRFQLGGLESGIRDYLEEIISVDNVLQILPAAELFELHEIIDLAHRTIEVKPSSILESPKFLNLDANLVISVLKLISEKVDEIEKFRKLEEWIKLHQNTPPNQRSLVLEAIDFSRLKTSEIAQYIKPSGLYEDKFLLGTIQDNGFEIQNVNGDANCAKIILYDYVDSAQKQLVQPSLLIELKNVNLINHITMEFYGRMLDIKTCENPSGWTIVFSFPENSSELRCEKKMDIYFDKCKTKYICIESKTPFKVKKLRVLYTKDCPIDDETDILLSNGLAKLGMYNEVNFLQPYFINTIRVRLQNSPYVLAELQLKMFCCGKVIVVPGKLTTGGWYKAEFDLIGVYKIQNLNCSFLISDFEAYVSKGIECLFDSV